MGKPKNLFCSTLSSIIKTSSFIIIIGRLNLRFGIKGNVLLFDFSGDLFLNCLHTNIEHNYLNIFIHLSFQITVLVLRIEVHITET